MRNSKRPIAALSLTAAAILCAASGVRAESAPAAGAADSEWQRLESDGWQLVRPAPTQPTTATPSSIAEVSRTEIAPPPAAALSAPLPLPPSANAVAPEVFRLHAGESLQTQLESWAKRVGWKVFWNSPDSWVVPNEKAYGSDFAESAGAAIEDIARNGADLVYDAWTENRVVVIQQGGQ